MTNTPQSDIAIVDGQPVQITNSAAVEELIKLSPLGEAEARRRLREATGYDFTPGGDAA